MKFEHKAEVASGQLVGRSPRSYRDPGDGCLMSEGLFLLDDGRDLLASATAENRTAPDTVLAIVGGTNTGPHRQPNPPPQAAIDNAAAVHAVHHCTIWSSSARRVGNCWPGGHGPGGRTRFREVQRGLQGFRRTAAGTGRRWRVLLEVWPTGSKVGADLSKPRGYPALSLSRWRRRQVSIGGGRCSWSRMRIAGRVAFPWSAVC